MTHPLPDKSLAEVLAEMKATAKSIANGPTDDFWEQCAIEAEEKFKGHFVRIDQQNFVLGCSYGYGAAISDTGSREAVPRLIEAIEFVTDYHGPDAGYIKHRIAAILQGRAK